MKQNSKEYLLDHHHSYIDNLKKTTKLKDFNSSIDIAYFIASGYDTKNKIDGAMVQLIKNVANKKIMAKEKNGIYISKKGIISKKDRIREIPFNLMLIAYHNKHTDNSKHVNPHIHCLFSSDSRMGIGFIYLKKNLEEEALKLNVKFNFMSKKHRTGLSKKEEQVVKRMSWLLSYGKENEISSFLKSENIAIKTLKLLDTHVLNSENLSYFFKIMQLMHQRLNELNYDFIYNNVNLRREISFSLSKYQLSQIDKLKNYQDIEIDLTNTFDREILKFAHGFDSLVLNIISDMFNIHYIDPSQLHIKKEIEQKTTNIHKKQGFRSLVKKDLRNAISTSCDDISFQNVLLKMGYKKVSLVENKEEKNIRKKTGIEVTTKKGQKMFFSYDALDLSLLKKRKIFFYNTRKNREEKELKSHIEFYQKKEYEKKEEQRKFSYIFKRMLEIHYSNNVYSKFSETLTNKYEITRSELYNITTFKSIEGIVIVDYGKYLVLKESESMHKGIDAMMEICEERILNMSLVEYKGDEIYCAIAETKIKKMTIDTELKSDYVDSKIVFNTPNQISS